MTSLTAIIEAPKASHYGGSSVEAEHVQDKRSAPMLVPLAALSVKLSNMVHLTIGCTVGL